MAPERAWGAPATAQADIYARGGLRYEIATGAAPHAGCDPDELLRRKSETLPPPVTEAAPTIPEAYFPNERPKAEAVAGLDCAGDDSARDRAADFIDLVVFESVNRGPTRFVGAFIAVAPLLRLRGEQGELVRGRCRPHATAARFHPRSANHGRRV